MFQQFKNIFPNATLNLRSLSESVGINDSDWNRGVERIGALRSEFNNILLNRPDSNDSLSENQQSSVENPSILELEATGELIDNLQAGWNEIHENNKRNFDNAKIANTKLRQLQTTGEVHYKVCNIIENSQNDINQMNDNLATIHEYTVNLMDILTSLEERIDQVSVDYEKKQFEQWKQDQEKELEQDIAHKRQLLKERENAYREKYKEHEKIQRKKRVELYEANFNAELEDYRQRRENQVSSLYSNYSNLSLEGEGISTRLDQVKLSEGSGELDDFLGETDSMPIKKKTKSKAKPKFDESSDEDTSNRVEILGDEDYEDS